MTLQPPPRRPPSKYLSLWISLPIIAGLAICGGISAALGDDAGDAATARAVVASVSSATPTPSSSPSPSPTPAATASPATPSAPPSSSAATTTRPPTAGTTTTTRPAAPPTTRTTTPPNSVYYANCDAVRAAGKAPLLRGQPGYRPGLDRDGDGVACEKK